MVGRIGTQVALLAFAVAIIAGISAGNSTTTILVRALLALVVVLLVGQFVAWCVKLILRDHLQRRKVGIDKIHIESLDLGADDAADGAETARQTG